MYPIVCLHMEASIDLCCSLSDTLLLNHVCETIKHISNMMLNQFHSALN